MTRWIIPCLLIITAGCTLPVGGPTSTATPSGTVSDSPVSETAIVTCEPNTLTAGLDVTVAGGVTALITVRESGNNGVVANRTYSGYEKVTFGEDGDVFDPGTDYRVTIHVNGTVRWNQTVARHERWDIRIGDDGKVTTPHGPPAIVESPTPC